MRARTCTVSFTDVEGLRHSVNVQAETLYEAVALAVRAFREHGCAPGPARRMEVEAKTPSVTHTVSMAKVRDWLEGCVAKTQGRRWAFGSRKIGSFFRQRFRTGCPRTAPGRPGPPLLPT